MKGDFRSISNVMIVVGSVIFGFLFLAFGSQILKHVSSNVILSTQEQTKRDLASILVISQGIPGNASINYTIPKSSGVSKVNSIDLSMVPDKLMISKHLEDEIFYDIELPKIRYNIQELPVELKDIKTGTNITINVFEGNLTSICKYNSSGMACIE